ncbi:hypothetical protein [Curtobacterium sp. C2H10]|uniref:hypothetical protein n=1 Tax=Curtobacterium sp. C2H10 TaxID=2736664 RepID=UPI0021C20C33|nr:hypothetical protein [Curtobacterium sp. C2H10]MCT9620194.1 hypothetical protein [Curtobacterium sp. C2H10]
MTDTLVLLLTALPFLLTGDARPQRDQNRSGNGNGNGNGNGDGDGDGGRSEQRWPRHERVDAARTASTIRAAVREPMVHAIQIPYRRIIAP